MIRLIFVLRRKPEMSLAEYQQYWRETHGPLVAKHATTLNIHRYIQLHTLDDPLNDQLAGDRGSMEPSYDGVAELWWTNREALVSAASTPAGQAALQELVEDEARFIDLPKSPLWMAYEYPQVNPTPEELVARENSPLVKLFFCLRHPETVSFDDAQLYWRTNHGPLIRSLAPGLRIQRYMQVHRYEDEMEAQLRTARKTTVPPYTGQAELWFDREDLQRETPEGKRAMELAIEDEAHFIDFSRSAMWIGKERVVIDRR